MSEDARDFLVTLLSRAVIAFSVEADNCYEAKALHTTTAAKTGPGPWLTSMVCWTNGLRHIGDGVSAEDLERLARSRPNIAGLLRWGYLRHDGGVLRLTAAGRRACDEWAPIPALVETRWRGRFGGAIIARLRAALINLVAEHEYDLPDGLPIVGHGLRSDRVLLAGSPPSAPDLDCGALSALLSRVLLGLTMSYEERSKVSLAAASTVLRVLDTPAVAVTDLPLRSGIARETVAVALSWMDRHGLVTVGTGRGREATLTDAGRRARAGYLRRLQRTDSVAGDRWPAEVAAIHDALAGIVASPRLAEGLVPPANGWRSSTPYRHRTEAWLGDPAVSLPYFPVVTHRGGWPDGS